MMFGAALILGTALPATAQQSPAADLPDPSTTPGTQSFLIERGADGAAATPILGTLSWKQGTDALGAPTLVGHAELPGQRFAADIVLGRNADTTLPASHVFSLTFSAAPGYEGGAVATISSISLKDEPLVPGLPVAGASARIRDNHFLFALSDAPATILENYRLLTLGRWLDVALVFANGRPAVLTLEKDTETDALFRSVLAAWNFSATKGPVAFYASEDLNVVKAIQQELDRAGCKPGGVDGKWGVNSVQALGRFAQASGVAVDGAAPTAYLLIALRGAAGTSCTGQAAAPATTPAPAVAAPAATADAGSPAPVGPLDPNAPVPRPRLAGR